ncbi:MAG: amidohydrolase [Bacteroidales bacterium]|nr:amidohydrolase [Bacteroidales bacterium]
MQDLKIAYFQSDLHWENPEANRNHFDKMFALMKQQNDLIVLPETFNTGFPVDPALFAETVQGPTIEWMHKHAADFNTVICGSILLSEAGKFYNTLIWMRPDGTFETYYKRHVFRMGGEHKLIEPGKKLLSVELKGWKIRPLICYDLRFPVWSKNNYTDGSWDYDLLIYIANWPAVRALPWKQLLIARAIENQSYVLGVNRIGKDGPGNLYSGDSCLLDAKGLILSQASAEKEMIVESVLSYPELLIFREKFNVGLDWDRFNILLLPPD